MFNENYFNIILVINLYEDKVEVEKYYILILVSCVIVKSVVFILFMFKVKGGGFMIDLKFGW